MIQAEDVVVTFNYDDSLERELRRRGLWDVSQGYGFPLGKSGQPSPVLVLKLHGSINWLALIFGGVMVPRALRLLAPTSLSDSTRSSTKLIWNFSATQISQVMSMPVVERFQA